MGPVAFWGLLRPSTASESHLDTFKHNIQFSAKSISAEILWQGWVLDLLNYFFSLIHNKTGNMLCVSFFAIVWYVCCCLYVCVLIANVPHLQHLVLSSFFPLLAWTSSSHLLPPSTIKNPIPNPWASIPNTKSLSLVDTNFSSTHIVVHPSPHLFPSSQLPAHVSLFLPRISPLFCVFVCYIAWFLIPPLIVCFIPNKLYGVAPISFFHT